MREPARSRAAAHRRYRRYLQLPLSCLDRSAQWYTTSHPRGPLAMLVRPQAVPLALPAGRKLFLGASQLFDVVEDERFAGEFKVSTRKYVYSLTPDRQQRVPLVDWHWHPPTRADPHIHVHAGHEQIGPLGRLHLPTARVSFEAVVRFTLVDLGVQPAREDWETVLTDTEARFREYRPWH